MEHSSGQWDISLNQLEFLGKFHFPGIGNIFSSRLLLFFQNATEGLRWSSHLGPWGQKPQNKIGRCEVKRRLCLWWFLHTIVPSLNHLPSSGLLGAKQDPIWLSHYNHVLIITPNSMKSCSLQCSLHMATYGEVYQMSQTMCPIGKAYVFSLKYLAFWVHSGCRKSN